MEKHRIAYLDLLNVFSCFSVVALHCNANVFEAKTDGEGWWLHVLIEVLFFNAVPVFYMLSGATLLDYQKRYDTKTFFLKRLHKAFIPFLFFSFVFYLVNYIFVSKDSLSTIVHNLLLGTIPLASFWFFIPLFLIYLFMPFLSMIAQKASAKQILALCGLMFLFESILFPLFSYVDVKMTLPIGGYVLYFFLGYLILHTDSFDSIKRIRILWVTSILLLACRYFFIYTQILPTFNYLAIYAVIPSIAIFATAKKFENRIGGGYVAIPGQKKFWSIPITTICN